MGPLYVCATPIGNLGDITVRALEVLRKVDLILAEDTRQVRKLLQHYGIDVPVESYQEHNHRQKLPGILARLQEGQALALVSDAGTPGVSDPGQELVEALWQAGGEVIPLPGPSALTAALSICGLAVDQFVFTGFLPKKAGEREGILEQIKASGWGAVIYESPHRIEATLASLHKVWPQSRVALLRELTKIYEEVLRGRPAEILEELNRRPRKGEMVLVIEKAQTEKVPIPDGEQIKGLVKDYMVEGMDKKRAIKEVAQKLGISKRIVYRAALHLPAKEDP
ncbi:MAG: 16S rRNA (cytidine(1402)-2'-O)-methyltransferase [Limnochordia bacterium]